ncbi:MAG: substrate-binding domain-containing protein [Spirochaetes bacterium]|nr:substrate-binding domain-containing protein [Spirochaetota bacterium]
MNKTSRKEKTLYARVREDLRTKIASGKLAEDGQIPTERDLCRTYDVSTITVRQAVGDLVRDGILTRIPGKGTFVNEGKHEKRIAIGLVIGDENSGTDAYFFSNVVRGVKKVIAGGSATCLIFNENETGYCSDETVQGVILKNPRTNDIRISLLRERGIPFVVIGNPDDDTVVFADNDNVAVGESMAAYCIERGAKNIAMANGPNHLTVSMDRERGVRKGLERAGINGAFDVSYSNFTVDEGKQHALRLLRNKPDAIIACDDHLGVGAIAAIRESCLRVPDDIAVICCNNAPTTICTSPSLTAVDIFPETLGMNAAQLLMDIIAGKTVKSVRVAGSIIARESTR